MQRQIIQDLQKAFEPYQFYWDEWTTNENCNLTEEEINIVNSLSAGNSEPSPEELLDQLLCNNKILKLQKIIKRLVLGELVFRQFVVVDFLMTLLEMARAYEHGHEDFLITPTRMLSIPEYLKNSLIKFDIVSIGCLVRYHNQEDFSRSPLYEKIMEFLISFKAFKMFNSTNNQFQIDGPQTTAK